MAIKTNVYKVSSAKSLFKLTYNQKTDFKKYLIKTYTDISINITSKIMWILRFRRSY